MSILDEAVALRKAHRLLAAHPDWDLLQKHDLLRDKPPSSLKDRLYRIFRYSLAKVGLIHPQLTAYMWSAKLKHGSAMDDAKALVVWAEGVSRVELRQACQQIAERLATCPEFAPVLVADMADFAFFSRLGWLVEYLPELSGEGPAYRERKRRYLAWRYREAVIVPASAGLASEAEWNSLMKASCS